MMKDRLTLLIHTCDKFSDMWEGHIMLLNRNWGDRGIRTLLVTDKPTDFTADGVEVVAAGEGKELSERIATAMQLVDTEYVFHTLDDYFLIYPIDTKAIKSLVDAMDKEHIDYLRLFKRPDSKIRLEGYDSLYRIDLNSKKDTHYLVNFYPGIWRRSFVERTIQTPLNAWAYELSLTRIAREEAYSCVMSKGNEFDFLDVVRKGKLLHRADRYFKKHPELYHGDREVVPYSTEFKIWFRTKIKDLTPQAFVDVLKGVTRRFGSTYYSDMDTDQP